MAHQSESDPLNFGVVFNCFAYFATGMMGDVHVMKVGTSECPRRRATELNLKIHALKMCSTYGKALKLEENLSQYIGYRGAQRYKRTRDYFLYDDSIYYEAIEHLSTHNEENELTRGQWQMYDQAIRERNAALAALNYAQQEAASAN